MVTTQRKARWLKRFVAPLVASAVLLGLVIAASAATRMARPPETSADFELPAPVRTLLASGRWDATPRGFRIIALSHVADGCAFQARARPSFRDEALECVERALVLAERLRPAGEDASTPRTGLYWSHLALILGARRSLGIEPDPRYATLVHALLVRAATDSTRHLPSYPKSTARWPADHAAFLAAVARFDRTLGSTALREWHAWISEHATDSSGLPWSEVTGTTRGAKHPRGCAEAFLVRYLAEVDPDLARLQWNSFRRDFRVDVGPYLGLREWPAGVAFPADDDSGPIVLGIGAAASAFGIAAARAVGDEPTARALEVAADDVASLPGFEAHANTILAASIRFAARWEPRW